MKKALLLLMFLGTAATQAADVSRLYDAPQDWSPYEGLSAVKVTNPNPFPLTLTLRVIQGGPLQLPIERDITLDAGATQSLPHNLRTYTISQIYGWSLALKSPKNAASILIRDACLVPHVRRPAFHGLPETLTITDSIQLDPSLYNGSMLFHWTFTPETSAANPGKAPMAAPGAGAASSVTSDYTLNLKNLHLNPGAYTVSVTADLFGFLSEPVSARVTLVASSLSQARIYPNPWKITQHTGLPVTFDQMPPGSTIKLYTVSGHFIKTLTASGIGSATWDLTNDTGESVASGIYLYLLNDDQNNSSKGKLVIIR